MHDKCNLNVGHSHAGQRGTCGDTCEGVAFVSGLPRCVCCLQLVSDSCLAVSCLQLVSDSCLAVSCRVLSTVSV